jgi:putative membrane protein
MTVQDLPAVNATLNSIATVLLVAGFIFIKRDNKKAHIACMVSALVVSAAFLTCYLIYHAHAGSVKFTYEGGLVRRIYFFILLTHIPLAALVVPMVFMTVIPALRQKFDKHKRIAKWTLPIWLYVSVTGVLVYLMLYVWFPAGS